MAGTIAIMFGWCVVDSDFFFFSFFLRWLIIFSMPFSLYPNTKRLTDTEGSMILSLSYDVPSSQHSDHRKSLMMDRS